MASLLLSLSMIFTFQAFAELRPIPAQFEFHEFDNQSGLQKTDVEFLFQTLQTEFGEQISNQHRSFWETFDWSKPYLGAGSNYLDGDFTILLWGGMVRARGMTFGALAALLCHEMGHYLGGEPRQPLHSSWASAEGQADHFAATVCLPKIYEKTRQLRPRSLLQFPEKHAQSLCQSKVDVQKCEWRATSGIEFIRFIQIYYNFEQPLADPAKSALERPTETITQQYPSDQCRMEIYVQGAVCSTSSPCPRARCWYHSQSQ